MFGRKKPQSGNSLWTSDITCMENELSFVSLYWEANSVEERERERDGRADSASVTVVCWCIYINCYINGEGKAMHMVNA